MSEHSNSIDRDLLPQADPNADPKSARDGVLRILWRRKSIVAGSVLACLLLAAIYLIVATPMYQSVSTLYVEPGVTPLMSGDASGSGAAADNLPFLARQCQVIKSTPILALTLTREDVQKSRTLADVDNGFTYLEDHLTADVGREDSLLTITAFSPYKEDAKILVDAVREQYIEFQTKQKKSTVVEAFNILLHEKQKLEGELKTNSQRLLEISREHGVSNDKNSVVVQRLTALSDALTKAQLDTLNARAAYDEAKLALGKDPNKLAALARIEATGSAVSLGEGNEESSLRTEMLEWQAHLGDLQERFLANHPRVQAAQRRVDQLNVLFVAALGRRSAALKTREGDLQVAFENQQKKAIDQSAHAAEFEQVQADATRQRSLIDDLEKKLKELDVAQATTGMNITVVEKGKNPTKYSPQASKALPVALVVGLMLGVMLACLRDWSDPRLHSAEEVTAALGLPVLGQVPKMSGDLAPSVRGQTILVDPASEPAEAFRSLRTAFHFGAKGRAARTVLIASPNSGDGKSTLVSNLAIAIAQTGRKVLVIDADLRRPSQHEIFGVDDERGLSTVLSEETAASVAIQKSTIANLDVLPCGPVPENPAEILNSPHFTEMLEELSEKYDHVIIDSPPVSGVTDARIIAASCDATILVLKAETTNRKQAEAARDGLLSVGGHLLGVVINGVASTGAAPYGGYRSRNADADANSNGSDANGAELDAELNGRAKTAASLETIRKIAERSRSAPGGN